MRKKAATIREVAEAAGVSISTVSNVLYGKRGLYSPETAQRVWEAVEQLGYRPNHIARSLARCHSFTIGVVAEQLVGSTSHNLYFGVALDGVLQGASDKDYQVKIIRVSLDAYEKAFVHIEDGSVEGVILLALPAVNPIMEHMEQSNVPSVIAGSIPPSSKLPCVDVEDIGATYQAVRWLVSLGHRRIGIITGNMKYWSARRREQGYLMALREAGIMPHPEWRYEGDFSLAAGEAGALELLRASPRPTAIVCGNDRMAIGVLQVLQKQGIRVPDDISIIGFDDEETAAFTVPPLTTIRQPIYDIGLRATELLLQQIEQGKRFQHSLLLPAELVVRETVAPPPPD